MAFDGSFEGAVDTDGAADGSGLPTPIIVAFDGSLDGSLDGAVDTDGAADGSGLPTPIIVAFDGAADGAVDTDGAADGSWLPSLALGTSEGRLVTEGASEILKVDGTDDGVNDGALELVKGRPIPIISTTGSSTHVPSASHNSSMYR